MKKSENILTAILITYNHEKWVAKAIESVLEQETDFPFIIKIFDDCSTDSSMNIARKYAAKYPERIEILVNNKNKGVAENFKNAFQSITTKYFCFLETDDFWCDKTKLQHQVDILEKYKECSMCGHNTEIYNIATKEKSYICNNGFFSNGFNSQHKDCIFSFETAPYIHTSSRMYRNGIVDFTKEPNWLSVDTYHYYKFLSKGSIYYIDKVMSVYNLTGIGDYTKYNQLEKDLQYFNFLFKMNKYFKYKYHQFYMEKILQFCKLPKYKIIINSPFLIALLYIGINIKYKYMLWEKKIFAVS